MLEERLATQLNDLFGMSHREYEVLVRLDGSGGWLRMSELAAQMVASQPLMSQTVNRLEKRGWVDRVHSTKDRRSVETVITNDGRAALREASGPHAELVKSLLLEKIGPEDLEIFASAVQRAAKDLKVDRLNTPN